MNYLQVVQVLVRTPGGQSWTPVDGASFQLPTDVGVASWGDFSRTTLDPEDDKTFWTIQQVAVDTTHWATQITALHIEH